MKVASLSRFLEAYRKVRLSHSAPDAQQILKSNFKLSSIGEVNELLHLARYERESARKRRQRRERKKRGLPVNKAHNIGYEPPREAIEAEVNRLRATRNLGPVVWRDEA